MVIEMSEAKNSRRTLEVRNEPAEETRGEFRRKVKALEEGELPDDMHVLNVTDEELQRLASSKNIELLRTIAEHEPDSINELSEQVGRGYKEVHKNVEELEEIGVIGFKQEGGAKKPVFRYDEIDIQVSVTNPDTH